MGEKNDGSNLSKGSQSIKEKLAALAVNTKRIPDGDDFNPLVDTKPRKTGKTGSAKPKPKPKAKVASKPKQKPTPSPKPKATTPVKAKASPSPKPKATAKPKPEPKVAPKATTPKAVEQTSPQEGDAVFALTNDFGGHTVRFSAEQYALLKKTVNYRKWKVNPKFSIKEAFFEAVVLHLKDRVEVAEFPEDFETQTVSASDKQIASLNSFVGEIRFRFDDNRYSLQRAIFEAIAQYLDKNPINL